MLPSSSRNIGDTAVTFTTNSTYSGTLTLYLKRTNGFYSSSSTANVTIHSIKLYTGTVIREEGFTAPTLDKTAGTVNGMPLYIQPGITDGTSIRYYWFFTGFGGNGKGTWIMNGYDDGTSATTTDPASVFGISDVLEAQLRSNRTQTTQSDSPMTKVDRSTYAGFSNKLSKGTPNQYWVERFIDKVRIHVYPTPDSTNASKDMHFYYIKRIQDVGDYTNATDVPFRFVPCMISGLAFYLAQKYRPEMIQAMKLYYEDELARALAEDGSASSTYITPKTYYPGT